MSLNKLFSLKSLIAMGLILSIAPLIVAVGFAAYGLEQTTALTRNLNAEVFEQTKTIHLVLQKASDLERKARLFILLSDPAVRQPYERQSYESIRLSFKQTLEQLLSNNLDREIALLANELAEKENLIHEQIIAADSDAGFAMPLDDAFLALREATNNLAREFENHVDRQFDHLDRKSKALEQWLFVKTAALLTTSVLLVIALLIILARSMRQLDQAILQLSRGEFSQPLAIGGSSDLKTLSERLNWLRKHVLQLSDFAQHISQNVAGQLETPIDGIRTSAEMLALRVDDVQQPVVRSIANQVEKIDYIRQELARFAEISATSHRMTQKEFKESIDLPELVESLLDQLAPKLQHKSITVKPQLRALEVYGLRSQLHCIIETLLLDALEHSPEHGEIALSLRRTGDAMELLIEDEGPALPPEQRSRQLEPFFSPSGAAGSRGLGLALIGHYAANHCGEVEFVATGQNHGVCRRLTIPLSTLD